MEAIAMTKSYLDYSFRLFRYCFITICFVSLLGCSDSLCWPLSCGGSTDSGADSEEGSPSLSIDDVSIKEGYKGSKSALFTIELSSVASEIVTVKYKNINDDKIIRSIHSNFDLSIL